MTQDLVLAALIAAVSLLYATAGQAGGTAFLAVMAFVGVSAAEMRPTALALNVVAAGYATWRLHRHGAIDWGLLLPLTIPSLLAAFAGGLWVLGGTAYFALTAVLLIAAALLMILKRGAERPEGHLPHPVAAAVVGAVAGLLSGLTGVGGGVFLTPSIIALGWASPRRAAAISPPFILANSIFGLGGVLLAGQEVAPGTSLYAFAAILGAGLGTAIGRRWMSDWATRTVLAVILLFAGVRLLLR